MANPINEPGHVRLQFSDENQAVRFLTNRGWVYENEIFHFGPDIRLHISSVMTELRLVTVERLEQDANERGRWHQ